MAGRWTAFELAFVTSKRGELTTELIAARLDRPVSSVLDKLRRLRRDGLDSLVEEWSPRQDAALTALYGAVRNDALALIFNRSDVAVQTRAGILGLTHRPRPPTTAAVRLWIILKAQARPVEVKFLADAAHITRKGALHHLVKWAEDGHVVRADALRVEGRGNPRSVTFEMRPDAPDRPPRILFRRAESP